MLFTPPGTYTYDLSGTAAQPTGNQDVSGTQTLTVDPRVADSQHTKIVDQRGSQDLTVDVSDSGQYVADFHINQTGFDEDFHAAGTALYFPSPSPVGAHWAWSAQSTDGRYSLSVSSKIPSRATVTIGGQSHDVLVVDSVLRITGTEFDLTDTLRDWVSTADSLILKERAVTDGTAYGASYKSDVTRQLRSTDPS